MSLTLGRDSVGAVSYSLPISDNNYNFFLAANTAINFTIPGDSDMRYILFFSYSSGTDVWVNMINLQTASLPTALPLKSGNALNPVARHYVYGGSTISLISAVDSDVSITLFRA